MLSQDTFFGEEQKRDTRVFLSGEEVLLDAPSGNPKTYGTVSAQTVHVMAVWGNYLEIDTWLGPKWILPKHPVVFDVVRDQYDLRLPSATPMYDITDAETKPAAELSPQTVKAYERSQDGWYLIQTWLGPKWVNPAINIPQNTVKETGTVKLSKQRTLYQYPNSESRAMGALAPQTITYFEKADGWVRIKSWLGDAWVLPSVESSD
ncbi:MULTISPECIES: hypothetical protein [unclassified Paenibacillus]|uniref:hypothetical protein n=1 Tax=unclassified Paenibacillus TaxID=185978 RepID=UPI001AE5D81D|nr:MULTISPECIES: hypothetical protein [unclassified Paenibacillus]MBP1156941.1 hypothetical protein [Paenibacillus sp. PvP091]MBP1172320.1 hypothetical protein [Paenibacillus sp. PvR098]MBP2438701.1 hypothetical protein [Paenibacillus sp. PvP052]